MSSLPPEFVRVDTTAAGTHSPWRTASTWFRTGGVALFLWLCLTAFSSPVALRLVLASTAVAMVTGGLFLLVRTQPIPVAVNANHPWVLEQALGRAEVMVCDAEGTWQTVGDTRCRVGRDPLLGEPQVMEDSDPWGVVCRWPSASDRRLRRWLNVLNHALALRDAVNGFDEAAEEERRRAAADTDLLERSWPEPEEALEDGSALGRWLDAGRADARERAP